MNNTIKKLEAVMATENIKENEPMKNHTSFKVGGPADLFLMPQSKAELQKVLAICKESPIPRYIIGNGSNLIVRDGGYRSIIIYVMGDRMLFVYAFPKNEKANLSAHELDFYRDAARVLAELPIEELLRADWIEITHGGHP